LFQIITDMPSTVDGQVWVVERANASSLNVCFNSALADHKFLVYVYSSTCSIWNVGS